MASMDWFRWHHGSVNDPKFQLVARKSGASVAEVIGVWATLLESASMSEVRGNLGELDFEALDCFLGLKDGKSQNIYFVMSERGLVNLESNSVTSWDKRQPIREREDLTSSDRVRAFRDRGKQPTVSPVEAMKHHETPCNAEKHLEEIRVEEIVIPLVDSVGAVLRKKPAQKRRSALPLDFYPNENGVMLANEKRLSVDSELQKFSNYHLSKGNMMADWQAAWRTWIGNALVAAKPAFANAKPSNQPQSFKAQDDAIGKARWEQMTGRIHPDNMPQMPDNVIDATPQFTRIAQ